MPRGFGTNFHKVYASDPELYHEFSAAESFSPSLIKKMNTLMMGPVLLDIACGTCHKTNTFSKKFERVFALDFSKELLEYGRKKYGENKRIEFIWSSAAHIPLLDNSIDTILITWGSFPLHQTLREMKRVLKPGGRILRIGAIQIDSLTSLFPKFDMRRINRISRIFRSDGFESEEHEVRVEFKDLKTSKRVLSKITGSPPALIKSTILTHRVVLHHFTKP